MFQKISITENPQNLIPIDTVKHYLRVDKENQQDQDLIEFLITAAIAAAENFIKIALLKKSIELYKFDVVALKTLKVPIYPIFEIDNITIQSSQGQEKKIVNYQNRDLEVFFQEPVSCTKLTINYQAHYKKWFAQLPADIIQGILIHVSEMYDGQSVNNSLNEHVANLYKPYKRILI